MSKIRLFEAFAGVGMQRMAFDRVGADYESVGISEIDKEALLSYASVHTDLLKELDTFGYPPKNVMVDSLREKNVGFDFDKNKHSITHSMNIEKVKKYYLADLLSLNLGDISKINGGDFPQCDVFFYSWPCQDVSNAGKQEGIKEGTRSGLVYEVLRILHELDPKPKCLIMENVSALMQKKFADSFKEIRDELSEMGYKNFYQTSNAKDYGVAQNRKRVFMVSFLDGHEFEFPKPFPLEKRLKDYLEENVDERYYLSDKMLDYFISNDKKMKQQSNGHKFRPKTEEDVAFAIRTKPGQRIDDNYIVDDTYRNRDGRCYSEYSPAIRSERSGLKVVEPIICASRRRDTEDGGTQQQLEFGFDGLSNSLTTVQKDNLVFEPSGLYTNVSPEFNRGILPGMSRCLKSEKHDASVYDGSRIRRLTPREVWRIMDIPDLCFDRARAVGMSDSQLYHQGGNGIVVGHLAEILKEVMKWL